MASVLDRVLALVWRITVDVLADPLASALLVLWLVASTAAFAVGCHLTHRGLVRLDRRITRAVAGRSARRAEASTPNDPGDAGPGADADFLADVFDLHPPTPARRHDHHRTPPSRHPATRRIASRLPRKRRDRTRT